MTTVIYALVDPFTQAIRYIGKTQQPLRARLLGHINQRSNPGKQQWIAGLRERGTEPEMIILDEIENPAEEPVIESEWINWGIAHGLALLNKEIPSTRKYRPVFDQSDRGVTEACRKIAALYTAGELNWAFDDVPERTSIPATSAGRHLFRSPGIRVWR